MFTLWRSESLSLYPQESGPFISLFFISLYMLSDCTQGEVLLTVSGCTEVKQKPSVSEPKICAAHFPFTSFFTWRLENHCSQKSKIVLLRCYSSKNKNIFVLTLKYASVKCAVKGITHGDNEGSIEKSRNFKGAQVWLVWMGNVLLFVHLCSNKLDKLKKIII